MHYSFHHLLSFKRLILMLLLSIVIISIISIFFPLTTTRYTIHSKVLPPSFNGFRIIQLSDLHENNFGTNQIDLIKKITLESPNMIVITGDLISAKSYAFKNTLNLLKQLIAIAPTYYIFGNHEVFMTYQPDEAPFFKQVTDLGVHLLDNQDTTIFSPCGDAIHLIGIRDPIDVNTNTATATPVELQNLSTSLNMLKTLSPTDFNILLAHRPEYISDYSQFPVQLVLSGHAHGGIVHIPFIGGLYAPNQGFFAKYSSGKHKINDTNLIISSGLGTSSIPIRILNPPEIVSITLHTTSHK